MPLAGVIASLLFFGHKRKKKEAVQHHPAKGPSQFAAQAFDREFARSQDEDMAAEAAIESYQRAGGNDPAFIAQIQYWTGTR